MSAPADCFINPHTGMLHRNDCHAARHLLEGVNKGYSYIDRNSPDLGFERKPSLATVTTDFPDGSWVSECAVCKPTDGTILVVSNTPKTPHSSFRIPADLKQAAAEKAKAQGTDLTSVIVKALERYVKAK